MRAVLRLVAALLLLLVAMSLSSLVLTVVQWGGRWAGGRFHDDLPAWFGLVGTLGAGALLIGLSGLLGLLAALRCRGNPAGGRVLTVGVIVGSLLGAASAVAGILFIKEPGTDEYLTLILTPLGAGGLLFLLTASRTGRRAAPPPTAL